MARYIDADALLLEDFTDAFVDIYDVRIFEHIIENAPSADVVEVVRCKDCKHYDIRNARCLLHSELADQYSSGFNFEMYSKDFCSYGERETDDAL